MSRDQEYKATCAKNVGYYRNMSIFYAVVTCLCGMVCLWNAFTGSGASAAIMGILFVFNAYMLVSMLRAWKLWKTA